MGQGITRPQLRVEFGQPRQAVILAGGRGTRLSPISDLRPKPMARFHGRPFLDYLISDLRDQGIQRILLLVGYQSHVIRNHFGDGRRWGVEIEYSELPVDAGTGHRL